MSFDLSSMERGELYRDRCMSLLLADLMQDTGAARPNAGGGDVQALDLRQGFGDFLTFNLLVAMKKESDLLKWKKWSCL